jgi:hypothetical protein
MTEGTVDCSDFLCSLSPFSFNRRPFFSDDDDGEERNLVCDLPSKWYEHLIDERMREDFLGQSNKLAVVINLIKETEARGEKM